MAICITVVQLIQLYDYFLPLWRKWRYFFFDGKTSWLWQVVLLSLFKSTSSYVYSYYRLNKLQCPLILIIQKELSLKSFRILTFACVMQVIVVKTWILSHEDVYESCLCQSCQLNQTLLRTYQNSAHCSRSTPAHDCKKENIIVKYDIYRNEVREI